MKNLNLNKILYFKSFFNSITKKSYIQQYPTAKVRVDKKTREIIPNDQEISTKKPEDVKYSNKFEINPDNLHDYEIIGAEIFKNAFKDSIEVQANSSSDRDLQALTEQEMDKEMYVPVVKPLAWGEPNKYSKHFTRRTYYDQANPKFRHMFVPSYRFKIEPFNSTHVFKWGYIDGDRKAHNEIQFKRNEYVPGFTPPFNINNFEVENIIEELSLIQKKYNLDYNHADFHKIVNDIYKKPELSEVDGIRIYVSIIDKFLSLVPTMSHKMLPALLMRLFYDLSLNSKKLWIAFEQEIMSNLHHFTIPEICQINYIASVQSPKFTSDNFRLNLADVVIRALEGNTLSLEELHAIALGFRYTKKRYIYDKLAENFIRRKHNFIGDSTVKMTSIIPQIFYSWIVNKPKNDTSITYYPQREMIENLILTYEEELNNCILKMTPEDISRLTTSLYLMRSDSVDTFINRIERNLIKTKGTNPNSIDAWVLHTVIQGFSKMKENKMCGSDKFFDEMESLVIRDIENFKFSFQQLTDIIYAYSIRGSGSAKLYEIFNRKLNEDIDKANNYHILHTITWHYLFTENKNLDQWKALMNKFNELEGRLPIYYYRPFKIAAYYLENAFKQEDILNKIGAETIVDFKDRFFDPEQIYDYVKYEKFFDKYPEYTSLKAMLNGRLILFPISHLVLDNMFMIHMCWENRKIGINVWLSRDVVPKSSPARVNKQGLLQSQMMRHSGYEILDLVWEDFMKLGGQVERDRFIHSWFITASKRQEEKGIFKMNLKFV